MSMFEKFLERFKNTDTQSTQVELNKKSVEKTSDSDSDSEEQNDFKKNNPRTITFADKNSFEKLTKLETPFLESYSFFQNIPDSEGTGIPLTEIKKFIPHSDSSSAMTTSLASASASSVPLATTSAAHSSSSSEPSNKERLFSLLLDQDFFINDDEKPTVPKVTPPFTIEPPDEFFSKSPTFWQEPPKREFNMNVGKDAQPPVLNEKPVVVQEVETGASEINIDQHYEPREKKRAIELGAFSNPDVPPSQEKNQNYLNGFNFQYGLHGPKDLKKAISCYQAAVKEGDASAQYELGMCYLKGNGVTQDIGEALKLLQSAVEKNHAAAKCDLAIYYLEGEGTGEDLRKSAIELLESAAKQKNPEALYYLGVCYQRGQFVNKDERRAFQLLRQSADKGNHEAQYRVGSFYYHGTGVEKDLTECLRHMRSSEAQGNPNAQTFLAICYTYGTGVEKDILKSSELLEKAMAQNSQPAKEAFASFQKRPDWIAFQIERDYNLGMLHLNGVGVEKNLDQAINLFISCARRGHSSAIFQLEDMAKKKTLTAEGLILLGDCYREGIGVRVNKQKVYTYYVNALLSTKQDPSKNNYRAIAQLRLGDYYQADSKSTNAFEFYKQSAELGNAEAQIKVGDHYFAQKTNTKTNRKEGFKWYMKAAAQGNPQGQYYVGHCYFQGSGTETDQEKGNSFLEKAANQGHAQAQQLLGKHLYKGLGIEREVESGLEFLKKAAAQGDPSAIYFLKNEIRQESKKNSSVSTSTSLFLKNNKPKSKDDKKPLSVGKTMGPSPK